ncbi:hypothetical protein EVAR_73512_1 [Eumeta japonica]|uniref:Reverse transcriptase domain-containing protein n=1 Tax=Eumeta variegata TaxID=151549 RepID=A0A4C1T262_EUMVA|nr:hypothetical protein EVAR_73512_1 [Eumeta japonica]
MESAFSGHIYRQNGQGVTSILSRRVEGRLMWKQRIIGLHLRSKIDHSYLSQSQHADTKGKSVETALHSLVGHIEKANQYGDFTMVAFMDIEGAFNNVDPMADVEAL